MGSKFALVVMGGLGIALAFAALGALAEAGSRSPAEIGALVAAAKKTDGGVSAEVVRADHALARGEALRKANEEAASRLAVSVAESWLAADEARARAAEARANLSRSREIALDAGVALERERAAFEQIVVELERARHELSDLRGDAGAIPTLPPDAGTSRRPGVGVADGGAK